MVWLFQQKFSFHVPLTYSNTNVMALPYYPFMNSALKKKMCYQVMKRHEGTSGVARFWSRKSEYVEDRRFLGQ